MREGLRPVADEAVELLVGERAEMRALRRMRKSETSWLWTAKLASATIRSLRRYLRKQFGTGIADQ
jgi:hypothetical protein